jgi:hypothetical protein
MPPETWPEDVQETIDQDPAQVELALLAPKAPKIQALNVRIGLAHADIDQKHGYEQSPMWLFPILDAIYQGIPMDRYKNLHTINVELQLRCGWDVVYLLNLPALEKLFMRGMHCTAEVIDIEDLHLPLEAKSSKVHTLVLHDFEVPAELIEHMVASCRALSHFECERHSASAARRVPWLQIGSIWLAGIMSALSEHRDTLQTLRLEPGDHEESLDEAYERLDGFQQLHALKNLSTAWNLLMEKPSDPHYRGAGDWQYPQIRDVLPSEVKDLSFFISPTMVSHRYHDGYAGMLINAANDLPLERVYLEYDEDEDGRDLPFSRTRLKQVYGERGVKLDTKLPDYTGLFFG